MRWHPPASSSIHRQSRRSPAGSSSCWNGEALRKSRELVDAAELARRLGIERSWVYTHAIELGAVKLGAGRKPRLRFDPEIAARVLRRVGEGPAADPPARSGKRAGRPRRPEGQVGCFRSRAAGRVDRRRTLIGEARWHGESTGQVVETGAAGRAHLRPALPRLRQAALPDAGHERRGLDPREGRGGACERPR